jgi:tRNA-splicing ligase RtcB (3'-phosphate/5'-hydroxy nucleic acid ligase)
MKRSFSSVALRQWLTAPLSRDVALALNRLAGTDDVRHIAVMPDVHLSHDVCTGTVLATGQRLYPQAVGSDLGCGMAALRLDCPAGVLADEHAAARLLAGLYRTIPALRHPRPTLLERLPTSLAIEPLSHASLEKLKHREGRVQFATLGRGNHFLEFQEDQEGSLWLMVHSGSRAVGQAIATHHLRHAAPANSGLLYLEAESEAGRAYLQDLRWACAYAEESRRAMMEAAAALIEKLFGAAAHRDSVIHCNHNHVRRETHFGEDLWVHRKGALSARADEPALIPGSMGSASFHVAGRGNSESLCSSSHGAGRQLSRTEARQRIQTGDLERQLHGIWFDHRLTRALREEAPAAYKDIQAVMRAQRELTRIVRQLRPLLSYKAT